MRTDVVTGTVHHRGLHHGTRIVLFANTDWYLYNFRLPLALALRDMGCLVTLVSPEGKYCERFAAAGLRFLPFPFERRSLNPVSQASAVARLVALYRREKPAVVHNFTIKCAVYGSIAARLAGGIAVVNAFTGLGSVFSARSDRFRITRRVVLGTLRHALSGTHVIVQNPEDRELVLAERLADPFRTSLILGSGVNLDRFVPRHSHREGAPFRVLLASRLLRTKGIDVFERAAQLVRAQGPVEFVIAGAPDAGNPDTLTATEIDSLSSRGQVVMLGHVDDMPALLSSVDLVVLPTSYGEGVPRILIESASAGLPLVATNVPGCREIVRPGKNGILIEASNPELLAGAILELMRNAETRRTMGDASRIVAAEFSEGRVIRETLSTYVNALAAMPRNPNQAELNPIG